MAYAGLLKSTGNWKYVESHSNAWCHGGSGILLSRIRLAEVEEFRNNERVRKDIERGIRCLMKWEKDDNVCICHGLAGKYMIMKECERVLEREDLKAESVRLRQRLLELEKIPVQEYYSTSFMAGIAGAGIALLPFCLF